MLYLIKFEFWHHVNWEMVYILHVAELHIQEYFILCLQ